MLLDIPSILQYFFQIIFSNLSLMSSEQRNYVKATVCAILFSHEKKVNMSLIGTILPKFQRSKSAVSKMFKNSYFHTQEVAWLTVVIFCNLYAKQTPYTNASKPWVLIFDTTYRSRFGKLLENVIKHSGEKTKTPNYAFVWSLLITPSGRRICFPCLHWYQAKYAKKNNLKFHTQPQLASLVLKYFSERLKKIKLEFDLVIVADSAFDCNLLWKICSNHNKTHRTKWTLITPSGERCFGYDDNQASCIHGKKIENFMKKVTLGNKKKLNVFKETGIQPRSQQKLQAKKPGTTLHFYRYAKRNLIVSGCGKINVVISYKLKSIHQKTSEAPCKIFLCNNLNLTAEEVICYYNLRWEVESFFKEQKSYLSFNGFEAWDHRSCYKYVDLLCVTFNFLEFYRTKLMERFLKEGEDNVTEPESPKMDEKSSSKESHKHKTNDTSKKVKKLQWARTKELKKYLYKEAFGESLDWMLERSKTNFGFRRLKKRLKTLDIPVKSLNV